MPAQPIPRWERGTVVALLLLHGALAWYCRVYSITTGNDDAWYLLLARSLRHLHYTDAHLLGAPVHSQYPPGFPVLLALLSLPAGEHLDLMLAVIVTCSVAALALMYDAVRRREGGLPALLVLALSALNPALIYTAGGVMSETPFLLFTMLVVWSVLRADDARDPGARTPWMPLVAVSMAVVAALTRTVGITMLAALFLYWLHRREYRRSLAVAVAGSLTLGPWLAWTMLAPAKVVGRSYIADATFVAGRHRPSLARVLIDRVDVNAHRYLLESLPWVLPQPTLSRTVVDNVLGLLITVALLAAGCWTLWRRGRFAVFWLACYGGLLAIWSWSLDRFLVPVLPVILWFLVAGAMTLARRSRALALAPVLLVTIVGLTAMSRDVTMIRAAAACDRSAPTTSGGCYAPTQRAFFAAAEYVRLHSPDSAVVLTVKEATFGYLTRRRTMMHESVDGSSADAMLADLRAHGVDYVLLTPLRISQAQHTALFEQRCGEIELVREFDPLTLVLRVPARGTAVTQDACDAIRRFERQNVGLPVSLGR